MNIAKEKQSKTNTNASNRYIEFEYSSLQKIKVYEKLDDNWNFLHKMFVNSEDIIYKKFSMPERNYQGFLVFVKSMTEDRIVDEEVIKPIMYGSMSKQANKDILNFLKDDVLTIGEIVISDTYDKLIESLLHGNLLVFMEYSSRAIIVNTGEIKGRSIGYPQSEQTIAGPRDSFVEEMQKNIGLIRKRISNPNLSVEILTVGKRTKTPVALIYLRGVIREDIPESVKRDLQNIDFDGFVGSAQVEQLIEKHKWTPFPQMIATERPDRVMGSILEGRLALIVNGTPFVLIIPSTFSLFMNSPDDYFNRSIITTLIRMVRYTGFFLSTSVSAFYIALTAYNPGLLPTSLALSITGSRVGLPFPVVIEVMLMEVALYLILEAAIRLPKPMGQTVGIVGGLVIGQSVVSAGIVSPIIVVIVAMSAIASFTLPNYTFALSTIVLRLFLMGSATIFGLYGVVLGWMFIIIHISSLESYGVKYVEDFAPFSLENLKDTYFRAPEHIVTTRPEYLEPEDLIRQDKLRDKNGN